MREILAENHEWTNPSTRPGRNELKTSRGIFGNPYYLASVFCLFYGLYLISSQGNASLSLSMLVGFYIVQVIYEVVIFGLGMKLIREKINREHGFFLLGIVLLLSCDATFYQSRITTYCFYDGLNWISFLIAGLNLVLNALELSILVDSFGITPRFEKIFCSIATLLLISAGLPLYMQLLDSGVFAYLLGSAPGWWEIYVPWFLAALCPTAVIARKWNSEGKGEYKRNSFLGNELVFYASVLLVPAIMLPIQFFMNIHMDNTLLSSAPKNMIYGFIPYALCFAFLIQTFLKFLITELWSINSYDFTCCLALFGTALLFEGSAQPFAADFHPYILNKILILGMMLITAITRRNQYSLYFLVTVGAYQLRSIPLDFYRWTQDAWQGLSMTGRSLLLCFLSFSLLGIGYLSSCTKEKTAG